MKDTFEQNGVVLKFTDLVFGKRSDKNAGKHFLCPVLPVPTLGVATVDGKEQKVLYNIDGLLWQGVEDSISALNGVNKRIAMDNFIECFDEETGVFDEAKWESKSANWSAAPESLADTLDEIDKLQDTQTKIINGPTFGSNPDEIAQVRAIAPQLLALKEKAAVISAKYAARVAKRKAEKAKKEAMGIKTGSKDNESETEDESETVNA